MSGPEKSGKPALILFGRVPQYAVGKRRLAEGIGNLRAWGFYRTNFTELTRRLNDQRWHLFASVTPDAFCPGRKKQGPGNKRKIQYQKQGQGSLGQRLIRQVRSLSAYCQNGILVVGTDIPDLDPQIISQAFQQLSRGTALLGPSSDGGFWCVGFRGRVPSPFLFDRILWSQSTTLSQTAVCLKGAGYRLTYCEVRDDIDRPQDYEKWREQKTS